MEKEKDPLYLLKRPAFAMLLVVIIIALYSHLFVFPAMLSSSLLRYPQLKLQDAFFKARLLYNDHFRKDYPKESVVTLIAGDEETLSKLEIKEGIEDLKYNTPLLARLVEELPKYQPKLIVLDIAFFNQTINQGVHEGRAELIEAIKKAGNVLVPYDTSGKQQFDEDVLNASLGYGRADLYSGAGYSDDISRAYYPSGYIKEGIGKVLPLAIQVALAYRDMPFDRHFYHEKSNTILFISDKDMITVPLNEDKMIYINFLYDEKRIPTIPIWKAVQGNFDPAILKGKIAVVGMTANCYPDFHSTPIGRMPGCVLLANQINTFVHSYLFKEVRNATQIYIVTILGIILACLLYRNSLMRSLIILIAFIMLAVIASFALFLNNIIWPVMHVIAVSILLYLAILIHKASIWELENKLSKGKKD